MAAATVRRHYLLLYIMKSDTTSLSFKQTCVMFCKKPKLIRNRYTKKWMFIPCGTCEACLIQKSISKSSRLDNELSNFGVSTFITLTYTNENIPFIADGSKFVARCDTSTSYLSVQLLERLDTPFKVLKFYPLNGSFFGVVDGVKYCAVLYKKDYQKFFKLLRKYGRENFKYFITGELGSFSKRPHFHAILRFNTREGCESVENFVPKYWRLCDWCKLQLDECIKRCSKGVGSYVSSYVSSYFDGYGNTLPKGFRPFTRRSNGFDYGFNKKELSLIESIIRKNFEREIYDFVERDFRFQRGTSLNSFSSCLISSDVFMSYFPKCQRYSELSFVNFCLCAYRIFRTKRYKSIFGRWPDFEEELSGLDLTFFRGYVRICEILDLEIYEFENFVKYCRLHYKISSFYNALLLKEQMLQFEVMTPLDYLITQYNTFSSNPSIHLVRCVYRQLGIQEIPLSNGFHTNKKLSSINEIIRSNHYKVLPKHVNSLIYKKQNL